MWCPAWCSGFDVPTPPPRPVVRLSFGVQSGRWQWYLHRPPRSVVRLSFGVQSGRGCWLCASRSLLLRSWLCHSRSARLALHTPLVSFVRSAWAGPHVVPRLVQRSRCAHSAAPSSGSPLLRSSKRPLAVVSPTTATPRGPSLLWSSKRVHPCVPQAEANQIGFDQAKWDGKDFTDIEFTWGGMYDALIRSFGFEGGGSAWADGGKKWEGGIKQQRSATNRPAPP